MAGTMTATVSKRISLGGTEYQYIGTLKPDSSYVAGGGTISDEANATISFPKQVDAFISGTSLGIGAEYIAGATPKVKMFLGAESGSGLKGPKEAAEGTDYSSLAIPFVAYGR